MVVEEISICWSDPTDFCKEEAEETRGQSSLNIEC